MSNRTDSHQELRRAVQKNEAPNFLRHLGTASAEERRTVSSMSFDREFPKRLNTYLMGAVHAGGVKRHLDLLLTIPKMLARCIALHPPLLLPFSREEITLSDDVLLNALRYANTPRQQLIARMAKPISKRVLLVILAQPHLASMINDSQLAPGIFSDWSDSESELLFMQATTTQQALAIADLVPSTPYMQIICATLRAGDSDV